MVSSNFLYHFTDDLETLISILNEKFRIYYSLEDFSWLKSFIDLDVSFLLNDHDSNIDETNLTFSFPVVCFSDIPFSLTESHRKLYGNYALVFDKEWGIQRGLNPVSYIERKSDLAVTLRTFHQLIRQIDSQNQDYVFENVFRKLLQFLKPYNGNFKKGSKIIEDYSFYSEREWRYILKGDFTKFLTEAELSKKKKKYVNHLSFDFKDLKYVLVNESKEVNEIKNILSKGNFVGKVYTMNDAKNYIK